MRLKSLEKQRKRVGRTIEIEDTIVIAFGAQELGRCLANLSQTSQFIIFAKGV